MTRRATPHVFLLLAAALLTACGGADERPSSPPTPAPVTPPVLSTWAVRLASPWGMAQLPDGRWLVTQKAGSLVLVSADGATASPVSGLAPVDATGQGGLLDVALDPDFATTGWVYLAYAEPGVGTEAGRAGTAVARARLDGQVLRDWTVVFRQSPRVAGSGHYGARLVFRRDKTLFITLGERQLETPAQDLAQTLGKVVRIRRDGGIPDDNPVFASGAAPGLWSLGHRNPQGAALHPETGQLWLTEHGPQGGDELNIARAGNNHGWPVVSYGCVYGAPVGTACAIGGGTHAPRFTEPLTTWVPTSVAPAGMVFYTGAMMPEWRGQLFIAALAGRALWRITLSGDTVSAREPMLDTLGERFRDVEQARDGALVLLTDSGKMMRLGR